MKSGKASKAVHLYFHSPCFDGVVSAALTAEYLEKIKHYPEVHLHAVNYDLRNAWLSLRLQVPCAVVDFLYHPSAELWADHHRTAFIDANAERSYKERRSSDIFYDRNASSCALLLFRRWQSRLPEIPDFLNETVHWADRIDSARYSSVDEAIHFTTPALQINLALATHSKTEFIQHLVRLVRTEPMAAIAARPDVHKAFTKGRRLQELGKLRLAKTIKLTDDGVAVFEVDADGVIVNRYAPFHFFPYARYSAGIVRNGYETKLTVMRNPWLEFASAPLGDFCSRLGGGGHQRVGSILMRNRKGTKALVSLLGQIHAWEMQRPRTVAIA